MKVTLIGAFKRNWPFGTEIAFAYGLREIGVDVGEFDPSCNHKKNLHDDPDAVIIFKSHDDAAHSYCAKKRLKGATVIEYQPDDIRAPGIKDMMRDMREFCDYAFTFDDRGARVAAEELGYEKTMRLLVTAHPRLYHRMELVTKDIDFAFVGSLSNPRMHASRNLMIRILRNAGHSVHVETNCFDVGAINWIYNRARVVLNHATDVGQPFGQGYGYQCRHFEAGFAGACVFSNEIIGEEGGPQNFCRFYDESSLLDWAENLLSITDGRGLHRNFAEQYHEEMMTRHAPEHRAREIVTFVESVR